MTDVENMVLYGHENFNPTSLKEISNDIKDTIDEFDDFYKDSLLSKSIYYLCLSSSNKNIHFFQIH